MKMAIEFFNEDGRGFEPKASIRKQGQIGLNQGALTRYKIKHNQEVLLGYDKETKTVVIKLLNSSQKGSKRAAIRGNNCSIAAKGFFDYFNIPYNETNSYKLYEDETNGLICFRIQRGDQNDQ
jgi:hypothetical protein